MAAADLRVGGPTGMIHLATPRSAYVHVPFCRHRCGYCNFSVIAGRDELADDYLAALATELSLLGTPQPVDTLYVGGGTPTRLSVEQLDRLCETLAHWHPLAPGGEYTFEANPEDLDPARVERLAAWGVNRLSLGAQSFDNAKLGTLERGHTGFDTAAAMALAKRHGMRTAVDLIFAAPGETLGVWRADVAALLELEPDHVSTYGLTFEKGTSFWNRREQGALPQSPETLERQMYELAIDTLTAAGLEHYEVSNFAKPGRRSRHNQVYWSGAPYFAAGCGAARYVAGVRSTNHRSPTTYIKRTREGGLPIAEMERLSDEERAREHLVFALRRIEGVGRVDFQAAAGKPLEEVAGEPIARFVAEGLLTDDGDRVRLTREGLMVSDALWPELL
ncbi:MAG: radical SAM family heme chaperone HemW [Planctomycetota bacterium]